MADYTKPPADVTSSSDASWTTILQPGQLTTESRVDFYSENAKSYDEDMNVYDYQGPVAAAKALHDILKGNTNALILDVGGGTGKVIEEMRKYAPYDNAIGLDAAKGMLDIAKEKGIYKEILHQYFSLNSGLPHNEYDAAVCAGTFVAGHFKSDCMVELCNIVKPGGSIVISMRREHLETVEEYRNNFQSTIENLIKEGRWKVIEDRIFPNFVYNVDGQLYVFQKL